MSGWITRTARKDHQCSFCGEFIDAGERYGFIRLTPWDHADNDCFFSWRAHPFCLEVWHAAAPDWDYEWCDDAGEFEREAAYRFPDRAAEYPWLIAASRGPQPTAEA